MHLVQVMKAYTKSPDKITREELISMNNEICQHANRKELQRAMQVFNDMICKNIANSHTYAAIINANIRCGKIQEAEQILTEMINRKRKLDVIICTTMMKGYCANGLVMLTISLLNNFSRLKGPKGIWFINNYDNKKTKDHA